MSELIHPTEVIEESNDWSEGDMALDDSYATYATVLKFDGNPSTRMILGLGGSKNIGGVLAHVSQDGFVRFAQIYIDVYVEGQWVQAGVKGFWPDYVRVGNNLIEFGQSFNTDRIGIRAALSEPPNEDYLNDIKVRVVSDVKVGALVNQTLAQGGRKGLV